MNLYLNSLNVLDMRHHIKHVKYAQDVINKKE